MKKEDIQKLSKLGNRIVIADNEDDLIFLIGNIKRESFRRRIDSKNRKWFNDNKHKLKGTFLNLNDKKCYIEEV